eukprot:CAMPEP_0170147878 /NCGR_PEP_ID=MMETSP0033_2-20121228/36276_1 /TAXON_ID=195969 /ORGANISM="Dolichomastix tenuilepis, Strain CCMP3274" /LENGTH=53 /DNA_ID=CAMNT_0010384727 /DNA_START=58 /DNA_END=215 /DNA_ORIENTATION=-
MADEIAVGMGGFAEDLAGGAPTERTALLRRRGHGRSGGHASLFARFGRSAGAA